MNNTLTALKGVRVGHSTHLDKLTGCTVIMFNGWYPTAYKSYGGDPGTFNTEILNSGCSFYNSNGIFIAGGSLTGLMSASDIMQAMIENRIGSKDANIINPVLRGAIVFDLGCYLGQYDPKYGREAFKNLSTKPVANGNVGAGTGTAVGGFQYLERGKKNGKMKAGVGSSRVNLGNGIMVCGLSVVNALGNVVKPDGSILAGNRDENKKFKVFEDTTDFVTKSGTNTTISVIGINVDLKNRENYERVAHIASHGQVRAIYPAHTSVDGDTVFVFSTKKIKSPLNKFGKYFETPGWPLFSIDIIGEAAAKAVQESIYNACLAAETVEFKQGYKGVIPSCKDYK